MVGKALVLIPINILQFTHHGQRVSFGMVEGENQGWITHCHEREIY